MYVCGGGGGVRVRVSQQSIYVTNFFVSTEYEFIACA
jgi:hypothetical protein